MNIDRDVCHTMYSEYDIHMFIESAIASTGSLSYVFDIGRRELRTPNNATAIAGGVLKTQDSCLFQPERTLNKL